MKNIFNKILMLYKSVPVLYKKFLLLVAVLFLFIVAKRYTDQPYTAELIGEPAVIVNSKSSYEPLKSRAPKTKNNKVAATLENHELDKLIGSQDAPVTVVEYSSFFCPHCKTFNDNNSENLKKDYIASGKVKYAKRMVIQPETLQAVLLTHCVVDESFNSLVSDLYANSYSWLNKLDELKKIAIKNGFTEKSFNDCIANKDLGEKLLKRQTSDVKELKLYSTPTIYINGQKSTGSMSYSVLKEKIDYLLK